VDTATHLAPFDPVPTRANELSSPGTLDEELEAVLFLGPTQQAEGRLLDERRRGVGVALQLLEDAGDKAPARDLTVRALHRPAAPGT
jgi:hypothetical protein